MKYPKAHEKWRDHIQRGLWSLDPRWLEEGFQVSEDELARIWAIIESQYLSKYPRLLKLDTNVKSGLLEIAFPGGGGVSEYVGNFEIPADLRVKIQEWKDYYWVKLIAPPDDSIEVLTDSEDLTHLYVGGPFPSDEEFEEADRRCREIALDLRMLIPPEYYLEFTEFCEIVLGRTPEEGPRELPPPSWVSDFS